MKAKSFLLLAVVFVWAGMLWAQQDRVNPAPGKTPTKPGAASAAQIKPKPGLDGDQAYKANCSRCHLAARKFSERKMATIMRHMRVRANLTEEEAEAILRYLTK